MKPETMTASEMDRSSRILVLSRCNPTNQKEAFHFVQSIIESSETSATVDRQAEPVRDRDDQDQDGYTSFNVSIPNSVNSESQSSNPIPWNIFNRYYSAKVHFLCSTLPKSIAGGSAETSNKKGIKRTLAENRALREEAKKKESLQISSEDQPESKNVDVFEALKSNEMIPEIRRLVKENDEIESFQKEVEGVPAVVLLVKRDDTLQAHRDFLNKITPSLFGFDLEVSLVVGLPSTLQISDAFSPSSNSDIARSTSVPTYEDLATLYAEQGWEYISLSSDLEVIESENSLSMDYLSDEDREVEINQDAKELGIDKDILEFARRPSLDQINAGAREEVGLDRIKEALETYLWPGLERKDDRAGRDERRFDGVGSRETFLDVDLAAAFQATSFSDWNSKIEEHGNETPITEPTTQSSNQSQIQTSDSQAQPESVDEALARAFLSKLGLDQDQGNFNISIDLNQSFGFGNEEEEEALRSGALKAPGPDSKVWKELEDFLQDEDPDWPVESQSKFGKKGKEKEEIGISQLDRELFAELANEAKERERKEKVKDDEEAWVVRPGKETTYGSISNQNLSEKNSEAMSTAFDDDFSDFVSAPTSSSSNPQVGTPLSSEETEFGSSSQDFPTQSEILATKASIFGSLPSSRSSSKVKETTKDKREPIPSEEMQAEEGFEFGNAMMAIQAHAERVRSIQDPEKRRREAARIALAFGMGLDEDGDEESGVGEG